MAVPSLELHCESFTDLYPLLMDRPETSNDREHVIDITRSSFTSTSPQNNERPSSSTSAPVFSEIPLPTLNSVNSRNPSIGRRRDGRGQRSPLNSGLWISTELILTVSQIVASIVVLSLSKHEHPRSPLRAWIVGYACGCFAILPLLYWRYCRRNAGLEQDPTQPQQGPFPSNLPAGVGPSFSLSVTSNSGEVDRHTNVTATRNSQNSGRLSARIKALVEYFKMALDCFFAVWFVVGNVWIFGGQASANNAPNLYRLCIVFLTFSCIGYAMPFILCATICCCLPCIISILGFREDSVQTRGATAESINLLPTYKFKAKKNRHGSDRDINSGTSEGGGTIAAGTDKERVISGEDAVCCICLAKFANNEELRELPCSHFFHKDCVDKWLKINALCPLCKCEVGETILGSLPGSNATQEQGETRAINTVF